MSWLVQTMLRSLRCAVGVCGVGNAKGIHEVAQQLLNGPVALFPVH